MMMRELYIGSKNLESLELSGCNNGKGKFIFGILDRNP